MTTMRKRQRRQRLDDWLDSAATWDRIIGYTLVAATVVALILLAVEKATS